MCKEQNGFLCFIRERINKVYLDCVVLFLVFLIFYVYKPKSYPLLQTLL